ncbi:MAG: CCA tRNA nucleotidyltransferase [Chloroflexi bacterium]|nr:CCA tRNA nucleotidyltransferase [Chloroflexota bacterium]
MPNLATLMERSLPKAALAFLKEAGWLAHSLPGGRVRGAFLVGGPVRDLLIQQRVSDLDIMVAGDVLELARGLAERLHGEVLHPSEFGTVKVRTPDITVDLAMARRETYPSPGALPHVEPGEPQDDLARRDYTINAMAVDLAENRFGTLADPFGGMRDITMKRLRVLHERSFADDPTRILRGLRYEARFGFQFEARTAEYLARDMQFLDRVSGARIRAELERIFAEAGSAEILAKAEERGILAAIDPALRYSKRIIEAIRDAPAGAGEDSLFWVALFAAGLTEAEATALVRRLEPPKKWIELLNEGPRYRQFSRLLENPNLRPSEVAEILAPFSVETLKAQMALAPATLQRQWLKQHLGVLRHVAPECNGNDLMAAGVPQGPLVGELLEELRRARLDGAVGNKAEELALVRRRLPIMLTRKDG